MGTDVQMPQMGESIYEGTITKWLKKVGDRVERDEAIYELSTDKVDTEIPSPVAGILTEIKVKEGQKVPIHTVVAVIDESGAAAPPKAEPKAAAPPPPKPPPPPRPEPATVAAVPRDDGDGEAETDEKVFSSPLVRRIAREEGIDLAQVKGTGWKGRITKEDILGYVEQRKSERSGTLVTTRPAAPPAAKPAPAPVAQAPAPAPAYREGENVKVVPMSPMRVKIAEHMVMSRRTSAHVTTVFEVDVSDIAALREREKGNFETAYGAKLTFTPFFAMAAVEAIKEFPIVNSSVDGTNIVYKRDINLGIAVALPEGLIVPVVKHAEEKSFLGLCRAISDIAERARSKKLTLDDIQGGTFTITNPGIYGGLFGTPIINQPQVAIMGLGGIEKRPVIVNDAIAVRSMCTIVLSFDHRVIDGAVADQFMAKVKSILQNWKIPIK